MRLWTQNLRPLTPSLGQQTISFWNFIGPPDSVPEIEFFFFGPPLITSDIALILGLERTPYFTRPDNKTKLSTDTPTNTSKPLNNWTNTQTFL